MVYAIDKNNVSDFYRKTLINYLVRHAGYIRDRITDKTDEQIQELYYEARYEE